MIKMLGGNPSGDLDAIKPEHILRVPSVKRVVKTAKRDFGLQQEVEEILAQIWDEILERYSADVSRIKSYYKEKIEDILGKNEEWGSEKSNIIGEYSELGLGHYEKAEIFEDFENLEADAETAELCKNLEWEVMSEIAIAQHPVIMAVLRIKLELDGEEIVMISWVPILKNSLSPLCTIYKSIKDTKKHGYKWHILNAFWYQLKPFLEFISVYSLKEENDIINDLFEEIRRMSEENN